MRTKIEVKPTHIRRGLKLDTTECAIAMAIKAVLVKGVFPCVDEGRVEFYEKETGNWLAEVDELPVKAKRFIDKFDNKKTDTEPFAFHIDIPKKLIKKNVQAKNPKKKKGE